MSGQERRDGAMNEKQATEPPVTVRLDQIRAEPRDFGGWVLDRERLCLDLYDDLGRWRYEVDLERCRTSAEVLDWICQVAGKVWATDAVLAGLVRALNHFLRPQANLCSFGRDGGRINVKDLLR